MRRVETLYERRCLRERTVEYGWPVGTERLVDICTGEKYEPYEVNYSYNLVLFILPFAIFLFIFAPMIIGAIVGAWKRRKKDNE